MKQTHLIAVLVGIVAMGIFAADASAMYHPGMGTFMQRDPGAGGAHRIGAGGTAVAGGFIPRDRTPFAASLTDTGPSGYGRLAHHTGIGGRHGIPSPPSIGRANFNGQYHNGLSLYEYVRSQPTRYANTDERRTVDAIDRPLESPGAELDAGRSAPRASDQMGAPPDNEGWLPSQPMKPAKQGKVKMCKWSGTITSEWAGGWVIGSAIADVHATGTDGFCNYAVSGNGIQQFLSGGMMGVGWFTVSLSFKDFEAPCEWPLKQGQSVAIAFYGLGGNAGVPLNLSGVHGTAGKFIAHGFCATGGVSMFVGGGGWKVDLRTVKHVGPTPVGR